MKKMVATILCTTLLLQQGLQTAQGALMNDSTTKILKEVSSLEKKTLTATSGCTSNDIQRLLNENQYGQYNLTVEIPAGTYQLEHSLYVWPNTTIRAAADAKLVKQSGYGAIIQNYLVDDNGGYDTNSNITIEGGIWDSTPMMSAKEGTESFRFIHCNNITIKNLTLCNVPSGSHLIVFAGVQNAKVSQCLFYGYGADGSGKGSPKEAIQLDVVHSAKEVPTNQPSLVKWDDLPCDNIEISGCEFYNYSRGIGSHTAVAGRLHTNIKIMNNKFHDLSDSAIRLYNYKDTVVRGNTIENAVEGILAYTYMEAADGKSYFQPLDGNVGTLPQNYNIRIENNVIKNMHMSNGNWGDGIRIMGVTSRPMAGVTVSGNMISSMARYGIFATTAPKTVIGKSNSISGTGKQGILLEKASDNSKISGNKVTNKKMDAIAIYGSKNVTIEGNTVSAKDNGIRVALQSPMAVVQKNTVQSAGQNGIWISSGCGQSVVSGNTIKKYATAGEYFGIYIYQAGGKNAQKSTKVKGNIITGDRKSQVKHGIKASESPYILCEANKISSASGNGIYIYKCKKSIVQKNQIKSPKKSGIWVSTSPNSQIRSNVIQGAVKKDAIKVVDSSNTKNLKNVIR